LQGVDKIIMMSQGSIVEEGSFTELMRMKGHFSSMIQEQTHRRQNSRSVEDSFDEGIESENLIMRPIVASTPATCLKRLKNQLSQGDLLEKLQDDEKRSTGSVDRSVYKTYLHYFGGYKTWIFIGLITIGRVVMRALSHIVLAYWTEHNEGENSDKQTDTSSSSSSETMYLTLFIVFSTLAAILVFVRLVLVFISAIRTSGKIHNSMLWRVLRAPINTFFDITPTGRLLNLFSKDMQQLDTIVPYNLTAFVSALSCTVSTIGVCMYVVPWITLLLPVLIFCGYKIRSFYIQSSRELTRLECVTRSPIVHHISQTISGLPVIRAYDHRGQFTQKLNYFLDANTAAFIPICAANAWISIWFRALSTVILIAAGLVIVSFSDSFSPSMAGLCVSYAISIPANLFWLFYVTAETERGMVSVERCHSLTQTAIEETSEKLPQAGSWEKRGEIRFHDLSVRYRSNTKRVLHNLSFTIKPREKVGIIGRTGAGKSTIFLCLVRILDPISGTIFIDDLDISSIGLQHLRRNISVISQDPVLFSGTLRDNLDPSSLATDEEIEEVITQVGFSEKMTLSEDGLEMDITEGGENLSLGERQLVCMGRTLLRRNQIVLMDEATASIDPKADSCLQKVICDVMAEKTILTIAHRIHTIKNYDRVLVMSGGKMVEFDTPTNLARNSNSQYTFLFYKRVPSDICIFGKEAFFQLLNFFERDILVLTFR